MKKTIGKFLGISQQTSRRSHKIKIHQIEVIMPYTGRKWGLLFNDYCPYLRGSTKKKRHSYHGKSSSWWNTIKLDDERDHWFFNRRIESSQSMYFPQHDNFNFNLDLNFTVFFLHISIKCPYLNIVCIVL